MVLYDKAIKLLRIGDAPDVEAMFCKAHFNNSSYPRGTICRPPNSPLSILESGREYLTKHAESNTKVILCGHFNLPNIDWATFLVGVGDGAHNHGLLHIAFAFDLCQVLGDFSRVQGEAKYILDLVFVSGCIGKNYECEVADGISDHKVVLLSLSNMNALSTMKKCSVSNFARVDDVSILYSLELEYDKCQSFSSSGECNINSLWLRFKSIIQTCISRFVPSKIKKIIRFQFVT